MSPMPKTFKEIINPWVIYSYIYFQEYNIQYIKCTNRISLKLGSNDFSLWNSIVLATFFFLFISYATFLLFSVLFQNQMTFNLDALSAFDFHVLSLHTSLMQRLLHSFALFCQCFVFAKKYGFAFYHIPHLFLSVWLFCNSVIVRKIGR